MNITLEQRERFDRDGYLVLPNFKSAAEIAALRARAEAIVEAFDDASRSRSFRPPTNEPHATTIS